MGTTGPNPGGAESASQTRRQALGRFLRHARERIRPVDLGLAPGVRRRTPGLRREEVNQTKHRLRIAAQSAGINHDGDYVPLSINGTVTIEN